MADERMGNAPYARTLLCVRTMCYIHGGAAKGPCQRKPCRIGMEKINQIGWKGSERKQKEQRSSHWGIGCRSSRWYLSRTAVKSLLATIKDAYNLLPLLPPCLPPCLPPSPTPLSLKKAAFENLFSYHCPVPVNW